MGAIELGGLVEPFSKPDFEVKCPHFCAGIYNAFLDKDARGNRGGNTELFERVSPGQFKCLRTLRYGLWSGTENAMADVFISFIHEEQKVASAVQRFLKEKLDNTEIFLSADQWQIYAGEVWLDRIHTELESAKVVILLISSRSVGRPWVNFEAGAAWLAKRAVLPVCFGGMSKGSLPKPYSGIQALDLRTEPYYLLTSVIHHLGSPGVPPLPPVPFRPERDEYARAIIAALDELEQTA